MDDFSFSSFFLKKKEKRSSEHTSFFEITKNRIASQTIAAFRCLGGAKYMKNSREFFFLFCDSRIVVVRNERCGSLFSFPLSPKKEKGKEKAFFLTISCRKGRWTKGSETETKKNKPHTSPYKR